MKYIWKGHQDRYRHKNRMKRSGQAWLVYVKNINCNILTTWRWARGDLQMVQQFIRSRAYRHNVKLKSLTLSQRSWCQTSYKTDQANNAGVADNTQLWVYYTHFKSGAQMQGLCIMLMHIYFQRSRRLTASPKMTQSSGSKTTPVSPGSNPWCWLVQTSLPVLFQCWRVENTFPFPASLI